MMGLMILLLSAQQGESLLRVTYDVELIHHEERLIANLALNKLDEHHFSISCRKTPGGTIFTYWATPNLNYLFFPKADLAFEGRDDQPFGLFPGGPQLPRTDWLALLLEDNPKALGSFRLIRDGAWHVLSDPMGFTVRWREKKRLFKKRYGVHVLVPKRKPGTRVLGLSQFTTYWENHDYR